MSEQQWNSILYEANTLPFFDSTQDFLSILNSSSAMLQQAKIELNNNQIERSYIIFSQYIGVIEKILPSHSQFKLYLKQYNRAKTEMNVVKAINQKLVQKLHVKYPINQNKNINNNNNNIILSEQIKPINNNSNNFNNHINNDFDEFELSDSDSDEPAFLQGIISNNNNNISTTNNNIPLNTCENNSIDKLREALGLSVKTNKVQTNDNPIKDNLSTDNSINDNKLDKKEHVNNDINNENIPSLQKLSHIMQWNNEVSHKQKEEEQSSTFEIPSSISTPPLSINNTNSEYINTNNSPLHENTSLNNENIILQNTSNLQYDSSLHNDLQYNSTSSNSSNSSFNNQEDNPNNLIINPDELAQFVMVNNEYKLISPVSGEEIYLPKGIQLVPSHIQCDYNSIDVPILTDGSYVLPDGIQLIPTIIQENINTNNNNLEQSNNLKTVVVDRDVFEYFYYKTEENTKRNIETQGLLVGPQPIGMEDTLYVQGIIIPKQISTQTSTTIIDENELNQFLQYNNFIILGWILIHPTQGTTLEPIDQHIQYNFQKNCPESIAVILSATNPEKEGIFHLTNEGMKIIEECTRMGNHLHNYSTEIYKNCSHIFVTSGSGANNIYDLR